MTQSEREAFLAERIGQLSALADAAGLEWKSKVPEGFAGDSGVMLAVLATRLGVSVVDAFDAGRKIQARDLPQNQDTSQPNPSATSNPSATLG